MGSFLLFLLSTGAAAVGAGGSLSGSLGSRELCEACSVQVKVLEVDLAAVGGFVHMLYHTDFLLLGWNPTPPSSLQINYQIVIFSKTLPLSLLSGVY